MSSDGPFQHISVLSDQQNDELVFSRKSDRSSIEIKNNNVILKVQFNPAINTDFIGYLNKIYLNVRKNRNFDKKLSF